MTKQMKVALAALALAGAMSMQAQTNGAAVGTTAAGTTSAGTTGTTHRKSGTTRSGATAKRKRVTKPVESQLSREVRELREQMQAQQAQIDELKQQNAAKDAALATVQQSAQGAEASATAANTQLQTVNTSVQANTEAVTTLKSNVSDIQTLNAGLASTISANKVELNEKIESPTVLHYKGVTISPVAFFALESVYRQRSLNSDINTPFNTTPYPGAAQAHTSEFNFSARQSRIGGLFEGNTGPFKLSGYIEADFLSAGTTSNSNESNSYTLRHRQFFAQAATKSGFTLTGGQMWTLVTENKKGTDNRTEVLPMTIDPQYHVGFSWARQPGIRVQQKIGTMTTVAMSVENAQILFAATNQNNNFFFGAPGAGGGLYNPTANYSNNVSPDVVMKAAFDPKIGHYEIGGLARFFRDRYYPGQTNTPTTVAGGVNATEVGGGFFANARFPVTHYVDFGVHGLVGRGVGRYGTSTLPDVTVHPDGRLAPIRGYQALFSIETHPNKNLDIFGYAGGEYAQRTVYLSTLGASAGKLIGYAPVSSSNAGCNTETLPTGGTGYLPGSPANCLGATRVVLEGTTGFTYRIYSSPRFGRLQYAVQYSYLTRSAWNGLKGGTFGLPSATFGAPKATNNMVFTGMRYFIP